MRRKLDQYFNKIFVIESLRNKDTKTGSDLYNKYLKLKVKQIQGLEAEIVMPKTKQEFIDFLERVSNEVQTTDLLPVFHIEIHGSPQGLELGSGELIEWMEMYPLLVDINTHIENNLLITLAVCCGNYLTSIILPTKRAPVWGLISIWEKAWDYDMAVSFKEFYDELLSSFDGFFDGDKALEKLNEANPEIGYKYIFYSCQRVFRMAYKEHLAKNYTQEAIKERTQRMFEKAQNQPRYRGRTPRSIKTQLRKNLLENRRPKFEEFKEKFFMYDLYPKNKGRFIVRFEDVMAEND
ncbi:MAG: hypothetical protein IIA61_00200 [Candidatus Marinimicrobia bacterium]|nr:hypothetical protein [Candidatus Neomarinimicrobiota bacterium]